MARVWIVSLADYNVSRLIGEWCDATDADELHKCVARVLAAGREGGEEYAIHDYDGFPAGLVSKLGEYPDLDELAAWGAFLEGIESRYNLDAVQGWFDIGGDEPDMDRFEEQYRGTWDSAAEYVEQFCEDVGLVPDNMPGFLRSAIDWEKVAHDFDCGGDIYEHRVNGTSHIFEPNA